MPWASEFEPLGSRATSRRCAGRSDRVRERHLSGCMSLASLRTVSERSLTPGSGSSSRLGVCQVALHRFALTAETSDCVPRLFVLCLRSPRRNTLYGRSLARDGASARPARLRLYVMSITKAIRKCRLSRRRPRVVVCGVLRGRSHPPPVRSAPFRPRVPSRHDCIAARRSRLRGS